MMTIGKKAQSQKQRRLLWWKTRLLNYLKVWWLVLTPKNHENLRRASYRPYQLWSYPQLHHPKFGKTFATSNQPKNFKVILGDGQSIKRAEICRNNPQTLSKVQLTQDFFPFNLGNVNVILGIDWLSTLREVCSNWKTQTIHFEWQGKQVLL